MTPASSAAPHSLNAGGDVGVVIPAGVEVVTFARQVEDLGFDYLSCGEHIFFDAPTYSAWIALAIAAGATETLGLMSSVVLLPLYPAAVVAKMTSELDRLSNGRFRLGVGVGGESPSEFTACGVPRSERGARSDEALEVIDLLLRGGPVTFSGRFNHLDGVQLLPSPKQHPRPQIWVAGRKRPAMMRAARYGEGWLPYVFSPEQLAASITTIDECSRESDRGPWRGRVGVLVFLTIDKDGATARRRATEVIGKWNGGAFGNIEQARYIVVGSPSEVLVRLKEFIEAGADSILLSLVGPDEEAHPMLAMTGAEVLPGLREVFNRRSAPSRVGT